jgi:hypothetical protein
MGSEPIEWTDCTGVTHALRTSHDLTPAERQQLTIIRQQFNLSMIILDVQYTAPVVAQARPNMMRMMLRILLPNVAEDEIAAFDTTEGNDLLTRWWSTQGPEAVNT